MASESARIRELMDLLEGNTKPQVLMEGWVDNLKNKLNGKHLGNKERQQLADRLKKEWLTWLGQTDRQGTMDDMERFMKIRVGFKDEDIKAVWDKAYPEQEAEDGEQEAEQAGAAPAAEKKPGFDPEEGVPLPTDLNAKLSDFAHYGIEVEKDDGKIEPGEIKDDPKKYQAPNGEWDRKKISKKLDSMKMGDKLTLGQSTFSRSTGSEGTKFYDAKADANESIMEAGSDNELLDKNEVSDIMNAVAARINDEYLYNGPENDKADMVAQAAAQGLGGRTGNGRRGYQDRGTMPSGSYDTKEMVSILKNDLDVGETKIKQITDYVRKHADEGYARMQKADLDVLARIGYALLRART